MRIYSLSVDKVFVSVHALRTTGSELTTYLLTSSEISFKTTSVIRKCNDPNLLNVMPPIHSFHNVFKHVNLY